MEPDVLIIGGGIVGLACAAELAGRGLAVELFERAETGRSASWAAAGMLAPLAEAPDAGPLFSACRAARDRWPDWLAQVAADSGEEIELDRSGTLVLAFDDQEEAVLAALAAAAARLDEPAEEMDGAEALARIPDLRRAPRRCLWLPGEHRVDNRAAVQALALAAQRRGARILSGHEALAVEADGAGAAVRGPGWRRSAASVVVTAGAWSGQIAGVPALPIRPLRGQMLRLDGAVWPWTGVLRRNHLYAVRRGAGGLLVGATVEDVGFEDQPTAGGVGQLLDFVRSTLPGLAGAPLSHVWSGLRPTTPDGRPILDRLGGEAIWIAAGHHRNGILLAPWTAHTMAAALLGESPLPPAFSLARFAGG